MELWSNFCLRLEDITSLWGKVLIDKTKNKVVVSKAHRILLLGEVILQLNVLQAVYIHDE